MGKPKGEVRATWSDDEPPAQRRTRAAAIRTRLAKAYPDARCALNFTSPLEILVATVLSAQCTDAKVNEVTATLFNKYRTPQDYLSGKPGELERDIHATGFFNQKAKSLRGLSQMLIDDFGGEVPRTMEQILRLPGVARKTANVVLGNAYGIVDGIAVDTHVHRLSWRLGFSDEDDPVKVERDLMALFPKKHWLTLTYLIIEHGRGV
ncbi:MAG TPA: endonuclease III, partial [Burkholderiales bacterium]|nr:endonuclease III [Burkholderiales bacterium]